FTVQGEGPHALGGPGGGLGYAPDPNDPLDPGFLVTRSVAVKFDLFDNQTGQQHSSTGLLKNGVAEPGLAGDRPLGPLGIDLHSGNHFTVTLTYDGASLTVTITDEKILASAMQSYAVDIPAVTGPNAHGGCTGAAGGLPAEQDTLPGDFAPLWAAEESPRPPPAAAGGGAPGPRPPASSPRAPPAARLHRAGGRLRYALRPRRDRQS